MIAFSTAMENNKIRAALALFITMLFWGTAAVFMRTMALALSSENSLAIRYVILSAINVGLLLAFGTWRIERADWARFAVAGLAGMAGYNWFVNAGFALVPAGIGTIVTMVEPLMIAVPAVGGAAFPAYPPGRGAGLRGSDRPVLARPHRGRP
jgi:drug/metabolite transporter (DMT)-like permease